MKRHGVSRYSMAIGGCHWHALYTVRIPINVSARLDRRGMRHKSNIQSSGGWRQPPLFLPHGHSLWFIHTSWLNEDSLFFFLFPFFLSFPLPFRFFFFLFVVNFFFSTFLSSSLPTFSIDYFCSTLRLQCVCRLVIDTPPYEIS